MEMRCYSLSFPLTCAAPWENWSSNGKFEEQRDWFLSVVQARKLPYRSLIRPVFCPLDVLLERFFYNQILIRSVFAFVFSILHIIVWNWSNIRRCKVNINITCLLGKRMLAAEINCIEFSLEQRHLLVELTLWHLVNQIIRFYLLTLCYDSHFFHVIVQVYNRQTNPLNVCM